MKLPREIGPIHFVGIGGIGMSGIAEVLINLGYTVQGSDASDNANVKRLRDKGAKVTIGHKAENVDGAEVLVVSSAIKRDNPELVAAREKRLPVVRRAEMLAELMRLKSCVAIAGTHGKTTTTSLVAALLDAGNLDPTVINGGIINAYGTNARLGAGDWMVVEADESDGTFLKLPADIAIVTNVDAEHLDHFKTFAAVQEAFRAFIENVPFYGFAVMCTDHPIVQRLVGRIEDRRIITYGENPQADVRLVDLEPCRRPARASPCSSATAHGQTVHAIEELDAADARPPQRAQRHLGDRGRARAEDFRTTRSARRWPAFGGVRRRFTRAGEWNGVTIIDDYGHHPVEIAAVLKAARESTKGQVIAVVQPHRYTRLQSLFEPFSTCFNDADAVIVAEVYPAGEAPIEGVDRDHLVAAVRARGHRQVVAAAGPAAARRHRQGPRQARRLCGLPRRRQHHAMGLCAGGRVEGAGVMTFPDIVPDAESERPRSCAGGLLANQSARRERLVSRRRAGAGAVHAGGRERSRLFPGASAGRRAGHGARRGLEPDHPRRRHSRRGGAARPPLQRDRDRGRPARARRHRRARRARGARGARRRRRGARVPARHSRRHRRRAAHERAAPTAARPRTCWSRRAASTARASIRTFRNADMHYTYRHSGAPEDVIFTQALFQGRAGEPAAIAAAMDKIAEKRKASQPPNKTGGSTFKNPPGGKAWQLIDAAGCRGLTVGGAQVSELHCNFLINLGGATAADIETLGETVRQRVKENSGVDLEWEIKRIGVAAA